MKSNILKGIIVVMILGVLGAGIGYGLKVEQAEIVVMSYNIRCINFDNNPIDVWGRRQEPLIAHIKMHNPDIIGMQEVTPLQAKYLDEHLADYDFVRQNRDTWIFSESNPIYFKKDKFTLIDSGTFWLSETPETMSLSWRSSCFRICTYAVLKDNKSGKVFTHFNTHLDHQSALARENGSSLILERIQAQENPAILTGDFNLKESTAVYRMVADSLEDTKYIAKDTMSSGSFHNYGKTEVKGGEPIDYIFVTKGDFDVLSYAVLAEQVDGIYTSDHYAVKSVVILG